MLTEKVVRFQLPFSNTASTPFRATKTAFYALFRMIRADTVCQKGHSVLQDSSWKSLPLRERKDQCEKAILNREFSEQIADPLPGATYSVVWREPVSEHASACLEFGRRPTSCCSFTVAGYRECLLYGTLVTENLLDFLTNL